MDWGNVPDWVAAIGTVAALVAASFAARYASRQVGHLQKESDERQLGARQVHASRVSSWISGGGSAPYAVFILNAGTQPVYDVLHVFIGPNNYNGFWHHPIPPADSPQIDSGMTSFINSQRGDVKSIDLSWDPDSSDELSKILDQLRTGEAEDAKWQMRRLLLRLFFTDANGVRWERRVDGTLKERPRDYDYNKDAHLLGLDADAS